MVTLEEAWEIAKKADKRRDTVKETEDYYEFSIAEFANVDMYGGCEGPFMVLKETGEIKSPTELFMCYLSEDDEGEESEQS